MYPPLAWSLGRAYLVLNDNTPTALYHAQAPAYPCAVVSVGEVSDPECVHRYNTTTTTTTTITSILAKPRVGNGVRHLVLPVVHNGILPLSATAIIRPPQAILVFAGKISRRVVVLLTELADPPFAHGVENKVAGVKVAIY